MKLRISIFLLTVLLVTPAFAQKKEVIQLQTQVQLLSDQLTQMRQSVDERLGSMRDLINQSTDNVNRMSVALTQMQQGLQQQNTDTQARIDQISGQIQTLNDSVDEMKARFAKVQKQLDDMQAAQQNLTAPPATGTATGTPTGGGMAQNQAPPPDVLYNNGLRDYNAGRYDLAVQQFSDYTKYYANTELAGNAQFYIADIEYRQGNFEAAVRDYDKVLEQFPGGNKAAAAQLKKGYALLELGQRDAGVRELRALVNRFPRSAEAQQATDRLKRLGASAATPAKTPVRRR